MCIRDRNTKIDSKFNELKSDINDMKQQKVNINKGLKEIDEHCSTIVKQLQDEVDETRKRRESRESELKQVSDFNSETNNKVDKLSANENMNNEEIINEVSDNYHNEYNSEIISDNSDVVENEVSKSNTSVSYTHLDVYKRQL